MLSCFTLTCNFTFLVVYIELSIRNIVVLNCSKEMRLPYISITKYMIRNFVRSKTDAAKDSFK